VTVRADRARFEAVQADDLEFPADAPELTRVLDADSVSVGRQSPSRNIFPDIDLGAEYDDPGISRRHLRFDRRADGTYEVVDCGSANGTHVNDDRTSIESDTPVALAHGDRVHLGAWTTITIERQLGAAAAD
jgi:pSer/pThr/pTyr-binding forkhead associated (FHA) protein